MNSPAYFFKFIPPASNSHLAIPKSFRKYLKSKRKNKVAILRRGNQKWAVKIGKDWVFGEGWDSFKTQNGVQDLDIVVFKHEGNMVFDTLVFDPTWCEREYSNTQVTKSSRKRKLDNNALKIPKGKDKYINESKESPLKANKKLKTMVPGQTHHPSFVGTLRQYRPLSKIMFLPKKFVLENGLSDGEMILKTTENEGLWTVKLRYHLGMLCIQQGMHDFCTTIGLEKGDSFRFELIHKGKKPVAVVSTLKKIPEEKDTIPYHIHHPYFTGTLRGAHCKYRLDLPINFVRSNRLSAKKMILRNGHSQMSWTVKLKIRSKRFICIGQGWHDFYTANGLKEEDHFKIELIQTGIKPVANFYRMEMPLPPPV